MAPCSDRNPSSNHHSPYMKALLRIIQKHRNDTTFDQASPERYQMFQAFRAFVVADPERVELCLVEAYIDVFLPCTSWSDIFIILI